MGLVIDSNSSLFGLAWRGLAFLCKMIAYGLMATMVLLMIILLFLSITLGVIDLLDTLLHLVR